MVFQFSFGLLLFLDEYLIVFHSFSRESQTGMLYLSGAVGPDFQKHLKTEPPLSTELQQM